MTAVDELKSFLIPILIVLFAVTVIVMVVTGKVAQFVIEKRGKKDERDI